MPDFWPEHGVWASCLNEPSCRRSWSWRLGPRISPQLFFSFSLFIPCPPHAPSLPPHSPQSGQVRAVVDSPLTLQGGRLEHVHPPSPFILCQSAGGIEGSVLIFIRLPLTLFFSLQHEGGRLGFGNGRQLGGGRKTKNQEAWKEGGGSGYGSNRRWRKKENARCPFQMDGKWLGRGDLLDNYTVQANQFSTFTAWSGLIRLNKGPDGGGGTWEMGRPGVSGMGWHLPPSETAREHMAGLWTY